jgi:F0F1-type ATP synthase alpha subunit
MALNLEADNVGVVILARTWGSRKARPPSGSGTIVDVPVGRSLLGRVVDALGNPIDGKVRSDQQRAAIEVGAIRHHPAEVGA